MFEDIQSDIYSVLASTEWTDLNIKAYPANYDGVIDTTTDFVRVSILPSRGDINTFGLGKLVNGLLIISIFVKTGNGDKQLFQIADKLDTVFQGKTLANGTQFASSYLNNIGPHSGDDTYYRGDYTITFKIHGE